jgi:type I restriction enzyme M protein
MKHQQSLERLIKTASDKMRSDDNTKGTTKYLEHFSWLLFLRVFEELEDEREEEALVDGTSYQRVIEQKYSWSSWTQAGRTGDELIAFIHDDLFPYLQSLGGTPSAEKIAQIFSGVTTVMKSGYVLAEVIEVINKVDFRGAEDYHAMSVIYETLLSEMGTEAGWSGEFYTPRPIVDFMTWATAPKLGETIYDPFAGSCGFLISAFELLRDNEITVADLQRLQDDTLFGQEAGELPFLLGTMNMILHNIPSPNVVRINTLDKDVRTISPSSRHDVVLTNPPFGGKENPQVQQNFPTKSSATEVLAVQHIVASLKTTGRCAVVVPGGILFDDDSAFRAVRRKLLKDCNLHTIVRLPAGCFPHTPHQKLNLLFFDRQGPTAEIWFYELPVPENRRHLKHPRFTKTQPLTGADFDDLRAWWNDREETEWAWKVDAEALDQERFDLDMHHPDRPPQLDVVTPEAAAGEIQVVVESAIQFGHALVDAAATTEMSEIFAGELKTLDELGVVVNPENRDPSRSPDQEFNYIDLSAVDRGVINVEKPTLGAKAPSRARRLVRTGDVLFATVRPYLRGHAVVTEEWDQAIASTGFAVLRPPGHLDPYYLLLMLMSPAVAQQGITVMKGAHYPALKVEHVKALKIPFVPLDEQIRIVADVLPRLEAVRNARLDLVQQLEELLDSLRDAEFGLLAEPKAGADSE